MNASFTFVTRYSTFILHSAGFYIMAKYWEMGVVNP
jgi:hypothetical protein